MSSRASRRLKGQATDNDQGTLVEASNRDVERLLDRVGTRREKGKKRGLQSEAAVTVDHLSDQRRRVVSEGGVCGALAQDKQALDSVKRNTQGGEENEGGGCDGKKMEGAKGGEGDDPEGWRVEAAGAHAEEAFDWDDGNGEGSGGGGEGWNGEVILTMGEGGEGEREGREGGGVQKVKGGRRASIRDKEFAVLVHQTHLLCLLARGLQMDACCDHPLLQASMLSVVPPPVTSSGKLPPQHPVRLTALARWFSEAFKVGPHPSTNRQNSEGGEGEGLLHAQLCMALEKRSGSCEQLAALCVILCRALGLTTRFVSVLDVAPIKPDAESMEASEDWDPENSDVGLRFDPNSWLGAKLSGARLGEVLARSLTQRPGMEPGLLTQEVPTTAKGAVAGEGVGTPVEGKGGGRGKKGRGKKRKGGGGEGPEFPLGFSEGAVTGQRRSKGDEEFEAQLAMAMAATADAEQGGKNGTLEKKKGVAPNSSTLKKRRLSGGRLVGGLGAVGWSRRGEPVKHWAEVFCPSQDKNGGRWVHLDGVGGKADEAGGVEADLMGGKQPVRYVLGFAGGGAKDISRRYVARWSLVAPQRTEEHWWDRTLAPLADRADRGEGDRASAENAELRSRMLKEPLPTNQGAYKTHPLYALDRWLTRYQLIHPRGPILGLVAGHPVFPRPNVRMLHTRERWMRECREVRAGEEAVKVLPAKGGALNPEAAVEEGVEAGGEGVGTELFGEWQTKDWTPPPAVNGRVPRNERGQIDVWSDKCLPAGTVHLRLPRLPPLVQKLGFDFAPAMVGFDVKGGRAVPRFEGLVVCQEHADIIMDAYEEEERVREEKLLREREEAALDRWRVLLRAVVTRQRLRAAYQEKSGQAANEETPGGAEVILRDVKSEDAEELSDGGHGRSLVIGQNSDHDFDRAKADRQIGKEGGDGQASEGAGGGDAGRNAEGGSMMGRGVVGLRPCSSGEVREGEGNGASERDKKRGGKGGGRGGDVDAIHVHRFLEVDERYDEESGIRIKICSCGYSEEIEEI